MDGAASQIGSTPAEAQGALRSLNPATSRPDQGTFGPVPGQLIGVTLILNGDEYTQCDHRETEYSPSACHVELRQQLGGGDARRDEGQRGPIPGEKGALVAHRRTVAD